MKLTYIQQSGSPSIGDAGDQYTGLDRFGRVVDQRWDLSGTDLERLKYGYDQASNQVWRQNTVAGTGQDQYYTDDGLYQLKTLQRGTLNTNKTGISGTPLWEEDWNYDPLGNWNGPTSAYQTKVAGTTTLNQNRTHNQVNEITGLTTSTGPTWPTPGYDAAGNMTGAPQPLSPGKGFTLTYDAWNRLVEVKAGSTVVADYAYDGASRRTTKTGSATRHYYYDDQWRVAEERLNATTTADRRFVWGIRRLDDLILRDTTTRLYAVDDKINVTAVVDTTGTVQERYGYNGFGGVRYMDAGFNPIPASAFDWETLFDSYRYDTDTGFYQVGYRYLHPLLGRWITRDPIEELGFQVLRMPTFRSQVENQSIGWQNHDPINELGFLAVQSNLATGNEHSQMHLQWLRIMGRKKLPIDCNPYQFCWNAPVNQWDYLGLSNTMFHRGTCCNTSGGNEWALVSTGEGAKAKTVWQQLGSGQCVGGWFSCDDCEGITCGGGFYAVSGAFGAPGNAAICETPGCDHWPFTSDRWTPNPSDGDSGASSPTDRGGPNNTPPEYQYGPRKSHC